MNCLDYLTNILIQAAQYPDHHSHLQDRAGTVRILVRKVTFAAMVELAFSQIRHYGCGDVLVAVRMIDALTEITGAVNEQQRLALLWHHVCMISRKAGRTLVEPHDRRQVNKCIVHAARQMGYDPTAILLDQADDGEDARLVEPENR